MNIYKVNELTWDYLDRMDRSKVLCILPVGALEQHGKHLPLGTDDLILENSLKEITPIMAYPESSILIYPHVKYGNSVEHMFFPGTVSLKLTTLMCVIEDIVESMVSSGFKNILIINSHGGNSSILQSLAQELRYKYGIRIFNVDYWASDYFAFAEDIIDAKLDEECHAGEIETSLLMHWTPKLVQMDNATKMELEEIVDFYRYDFSWLSSDVSESGVIGNATHSSPEKGRKLAEQMNHKLSLILEEIFSLLSDD